MDLAGLSAVLKPLPEACYILADNGRFLASNPAGSRMLGVPEDVLKGRNIVDFVISDMAKVNAYLSRCSSNAQLVPGTIVWRDINGTTVDTKAEGAALRYETQDSYILLRCRPRQESAGSFLQLNKELAVLRQAHRQLEEDKSHLEEEVNLRTAALKASEVRCRGIVQAAAEGIVTISEDGMIDSFNLAAAAMFGYSADEVIGEDIALLLPEAKNYTDSQNGQWQWPRKTHQDGEITFNETKGRRKDGQQFYIEYSVSQIQLDEESLYIVIMRDITERMQTQKQLAKYANSLVSYTSKLEQKNAELDQFAYVTSHDLKAPLRAISNLASWIEEDLAEKLDEGSRKQLDLLRGRVYRMEALIDGILQYSRVGRFQTEVETVDTNELLSEVIDSLQPPEGFHIDVAPQLPVLETSRIWLQQVFANLISNAVKYHDRADGRVAVAVEDAGEFYAFTVSDDGPGIEEKFHEKIFVIFQTLEARDTRESTGIGLTIVKKIIEEQGGAITVNSEPGKGASFRFLWPRQPMNRGEAHDG